jgi:hypothetical protein
MSSKVSSLREESETPTSSRAEDNESSSPWGVQTGTSVGESLICEQDTCLTSGMTRSHGAKKCTIFAPHSTIKRARGDDSTWAEDDRKYPIVMYAYRKSRRDSDKSSGWEPERVPIIETRAPVENS